MRRTNPKKVANPTKISSLLLESVQPEEEHKLRLEGQVIRRNVSGKMRQFLGGTSLEIIGSSAHL